MENGVNVGVRLCTLCSFQWKWKVSESDEYENEGVNNDRILPIAEVNCPEHAITTSTVWGSYGGPANWTCIESSDVTDSPIITSTPQSGILVHVYHPTTKTKLTKKEVSNMINQGSN